MSKSPDLQRNAEEEIKLVFDLLLNNFHLEIANTFHKYLQRNDKYH